MLRSLSFGAAVAAMLVIPFTQADARHGGMGGARMGGAHFSGVRSFSGGPRFSAGPRFTGVRSFNVGRRVAFVGPRFRHHRRFVGFYSVGLYGTCWRWVPTAYGLRRVWVCDYPYSYYY